ncbi:Hypothetical protein NTJ_09560 [Nesidiocoris tenuis]|uniref:Uncharacterized protein n=1 Tax=Nesidiocoris tenuis TaxID=355587 RepID=A0ABN7AX48_9HEMI|nr:Hypothetical protein NTJ_09560 [Nesidiocoris tenuis]
MKKTRWAFLWTILAILFAVLAALSGSALISSIIALVLSSLVVLRSALGGGASGFAAPSALGYALPVEHTGAGKITAYEISPEYYMDDNSHAMTMGAPLAYSAYARQTALPLTNISRSTRR